MIQSELLKRAKEIALEQGELANSPGEASTNGRLVLCAAACIARAFAERTGSNDAVFEFEEKVLVEPKETYIPGVFKRAGMSSELAAAVMIENDRTPKRQRLDWFSAFEC